MILRGWALAAAGSVEEGVATIRDGLALVPHGGSRAHRSWHLLMLAETELRAGRPDEALQAVRSAKGFAAETGERVLEPELWRIEAEAGRVAGLPEEEVASALRTSAEIASVRNEPPLALRAATSRFRLMPDDASRDVLRRWVESFTEGLEVPDLVDARELLDRA